MCLIIKYITVLVLLDQYLLTYTLPVARLKMLIVYLEAFVAEGM